MQRNLLLALLFSALIMNMTTLGIFLLGEGNTLLSIRLENGKKYEEATFASEVLAYGKTVFRFISETNLQKKLHLFRSKTVFEGLNTCILAIRDWLLLLIYHWKKY